MKDKYIRFQQFYKKLDTKDELLRKGRKRGFSGFTPEDAAEVEKLKKPRSTWVPWTVIQKV